MIPVILALVLGAFSSSEENVLILVADDLGVDSLQAYGVGADLPGTPHIDKLASEGILFRNAWSNSTCSPTRATLMTGRYSFRTGIGWAINQQSEFALPLEEITLPEMLDLGSEGTYSHAAFGKWHLGNESVGGVLAPNLAGFGHFAGIRGNITGADDSFYSWDQVIDGRESRFEGYATTEHVDSALEWLAGAQEPWVAYVAFNNPHTPFHAPPDHLHTVDLSEAGDPHENPRPYFKAMVEAMDTEMGRLIAGLGPMEERTTIIFLGDNGTLGSVIVDPFDPDHSKGTLYEGGINIPLIIKSPLVQTPGVECEAIVNTVDLFPTVAEIAGVDLASAMPQETILDGVSMLPYFIDPLHEPLRQTVLAEQFVPNGFENHGWQFPAGLDRDCHCQKDLGYGGPGSLQLRMCGDPMAKGGFAEFELTKAPPLATGVLHIAMEFNPTDLLGGTLVPYPPLLTSPFVTDAQGRYVVPVEHLGGGSANGDLIAYVQALVWDLEQPGGASISNALEIAFLGESSKAIRNRCFKLIMSSYGVEEEFFDLCLDPREENDLLLQGSLSLVQSQNYWDLRNRLLSLVDPDYLPPSDLGLHQGGRLECGR